MAHGDYLEIAALQTAPATSTTIAGVSRICGNFWNASPGTTVHATTCSFATPFKVGVHFDQDDTLFSPVDAAAITHSENNPSSSGSGIGYTGFYLDYWQATC